MAMMALACLFFLSLLLPLPTPDQMALLGRLAHWSFHPHLLWLVDGAVAHLLLALGGGLLLPPNFALAGPPLLGLLLPPPFLLFAGHVPFFGRTVVVVVADLAC